MDSSVHIDYIIQRMPDYHGQDNWVDFLHKGDNPKEAEKHLAQIVEKNADSSNYFWRIIKVKKKVEVTIKVMSVSGPKGPLTIKHDLKEIALVIKNIDFNNRQSKRLYFHQDKYKDNGFSGLHVTSSRYYPSRKKLEVNTDEGWLEVEEKDILIYR